jgi:hypothetical protein
VAASSTWSTSDAGIATVATVFGGTVTVCEWAPDDALTDLVKVGQGKGDGEEGLVSGQSPTMSDCFFFASRLQQRPPQGGRIVQSGTVSRAKERGNRTKQREEPKGDDHGPC